MIGKTKFWFKPLLDDLVNEVMIQVNPVDPSDAGQDEVEEEDVIKVLSRICTHLSPVNIIFSAKNDIKVKE